MSGGHTESVLFNFPLLLLMICAPVGAEPAQNPGSESHEHEKFEMKVTKGVIISYDFKAVAPWLKIKDETGKECTVAVDFKVSKIHSNGKEVVWDSLQEGEKVEIEYAAESASQNIPAKLVLHSVTVRT